MILHFIDGEARASHNRASFDAVDPWTQVTHSRVALAGEREVADAVAAARRAFDDGPWPRMGFAERGAILHRLADRLLDNVDELATADTTDMGKPLEVMRSQEVPRAATNFRFFADHARLSEAERYPMDSGHHAYTAHAPAGVVAAIAPWNFPLMLESWKVAPALAWGNTVVLKPAEGSPSSAAILARLAVEAGMPPGVLNVVHGYGPASAGEFLVRSAGVDRITFTGESATGKIIATAAAARLTPVSLELGGKGANVVFADADLDAAVAWSNRAIYTNAGQICLAGSRIYVERPIYDAFVRRFVESAEAMVVGDPRDQTTQIGPLASREHFEKVAGYLTADDGGKVLTGGLAGDGSWVVRPTVIVEAPEHARIWRDEVFGPIATIAPFDSEDEVIRRANDTPYGLNAMLFTEDLRRAHRVAARLRGGTVWVNCFFIRDLRAPFGGVKDSGLGREGGRYSREFFTEPKVIIMDVS